MKKLHPKIVELQLRASTLWLGEFGEATTTRATTNANKLKQRFDLKDNQELAYYCPYGVKDQHGTGWLRGCFNKSIADRGPKSSANQKIFTAWWHNVTDPIGKPIEMGDDEFGAWALTEFDDPDAVPSSKRAMAQLRSGTVNGWSFGSNPLWKSAEYDENNDTVWIKEAELYEISPVTLPSLVGTMTVRSIADYEDQKLMLDEETTDFIKSLPKNKQLELRHLIFRHTSLAKIMPEVLPQNPGGPKNGENKLYKVGNLKINLTKL